MTCVIEYVASAPAADATDPDTMTAVARATSATKAPPSARSFLLRTELLPSTTCRYANLKPVRAGTAFTWYPRGGPGSFEAHYPRGAAAERGTVFRQAGHWRYARSERLHRRISLGRARPTHEQQVKLPGTPPMGGGRNRLWEIHWRPQPLRWAKRLICDALKTSPPDSGTTVSPRSIPLRRARTFPLLRRPRAPDAQVSEKSQEPPRQWQQLVTVRPLPANTAVRRCPVDRGSVSAFDYTGARGLHRDRTKRHHL